MSVTPAELIVKPGDHVVHFYRDDAELAATVGAQLADTLAAGALAVSIATRPHLDALERELAAAGAVVQRAVEDGRWTVLDAAATLARILVDGRVSEDALEREVLSLIRPALAGGACVYVYGEMVDLLWQAGDVPGAIELERLWSGAEAELQCSLLCAYKSAAVSAPGHEHALVDLCDLHSAVSIAPPASDRVAGPLEVSREFRPEEDAPRAARRFLEQSLARWGYTGPLVDDARLLVSELVTNAVTHARSPLSVSIRSQHPSVRVSVRDESPIKPIVRAPRPDADSGRGLQIVAAVSRHWGVDAAPEGKTVWAEV
jgi:hypothetical protein